MKKKLWKKNLKKKVKMPKMALFCALHFSTEQNICFGHIVRPLANRQAEAAYRDILGQSYVHALSAEWNAADRGLTGPPLIGSLPL